MDRIENKFGKTSVLTGQSAVTLLESKVSEGFQSPGIIANEDYRNFFERTVHRKESSDLSFITGLAATGLRVGAFLEGNDLVSNYHQLVSSVRQHLPWVIHVSTQSRKQPMISNEPDHSNYHAVANTGCFQLFATNVQEVVDLGFISHKVAELSLIPGINGMDSYSTSFSAQDVEVPGREAIEKFLGNPDDQISSPTPAQEMIFGNTRRRVPNWFNFDYPTLIGALKDGQTLGYEAVANLEFFYRHLSMVIGEVLSEYGVITGRHYQPVGSYKAEDAKYLVVTQGAAFNQITKIVDYLRSKKERVGCLNLRLYRPFPMKELTQWVSGKKGVTILERVGQPLASGAPIFSELVAAFHGRADSFPSNLFSGIYGIGGLELTDEEIIGTFENMIRGREARKKFYLGISYSKKSSSFPKQQILLQNLNREYPELEKDSLEPVKFSGLPKSKTFLFYFSFLPGELNFQNQVEELLGPMQDLYDVRINGKLENRGYKVWMSQELQSNLPDKDGTIDCIFASPGSLRSEKKLKGALTEKSRLVIISREKASDDPFTFPADIINEVNAKQVNVYHLAIDREQPIVQALQGALINILSDFLKDDRKEKILESIESYYQKNFLDLTEVRKFSIDAGLTNLEDITGQLCLESEETTNLDLPFEVRQSKDQGPPYFQLSHFYNNVGHFYEIGNKEELVADPFQAISAIPSATSNFLNLVEGRSEVPVFKPDSCTGCGECYVLCPHSAIPPIVIGVSSLIQGAMEIATSRGIEISKLTPVVKNLAKVASKIVKESKKGISQVSDFLPAAFTKLVEQMKLEGEKLNALKTDFDKLTVIIGEFQVAATQPFFTGPEVMEKGSGELFSLGINPRACTGCGVCAIVCNDGALEMGTQTPKIISQMQSNFGLWEQLPDTPGETITRMHSDKEYDSFAAILLSRNFYQSMTGGYFSETGAPVKTLMHLVTATTECVFQPRILNLAGEIKELIDSLSANIHSKLSEALPKEDFEGLSKVIGETRGQRVPIDEMVDKLRSKEHMKLVDVSSLQRKIDLLNSLKHLNWILTEGPNGRGRSRFGVTMSDHDSLLWAKEYPYNFFYTPVLIQSDNITPDLALGLFKGHLRHQLDNLKILRRARLEVKDKYEPGIHDEKIASLRWKELDDSEKALIPPILLVGEINSWAEKDLSKLNSVMSSDSLLKIIVIDNCLLPEPKDPVDHLGKGINMLLAGLTTRNAFILQSSLGARSHMFNGLMEGIQTPGPALFYLYAPDQDQHSIYGNNWSKLSSQAVKTRAFPLLKFNPNMGNGFISSSFDMESNPSADKDWTTIELKYIDGEQEKTLLYTLTYADWAFSQTNLTHHFKVYIEDQGNPIPVSDFLALAEGGGGGENQVPVILMVDNQGILKKFSVSPHIIAACRAMLINWNTIREIGGILVPFPQKLRDQVEQEFNEKHEKEILKLKSEFQNKLKELEKTQLEAVKKKLRDKLLALSSRAKFNQE